METGLRRSPRADLRLFRSGMKQEVVREELLIVGLGNPESEYADTRHNLGFACVRELGQRLGIKPETANAGSPWSGTPRRSGIYRLRAMQTYMNLSGQPVAKAVRDLNLMPGRVWVVHDELDLPLCRLRVRRGGSGAGHNGVLSALSIASLKVRRTLCASASASASRPARAHLAGRSYVLGRFTKVEAARIPDVVDGVAGALELAIEAGLERAMEQFNRPGALGCEELK